MIKARGRNLRTVAGVGAVLAFIILIVASNWLTSRYGLVWGFVTAGTFTAGLVLAARDAVREVTGILGALACVAAGATLSVVMSNPALAIASGVAFAVSELADTVIYEPLRTGGRLRALAWSNLIGSIVDSLIFLAIAGFPIWPSIVGQVAVKWIICVALPVLAVGGARAVLRHRVRTAGA